MFDCIKKLFKKKPTKKKATSDDAKVPETEPAK